MTGKETIRKTGRPAEEGFPVAVIERRGDLLHPHKGSWKPADILRGDECGGMDEGELMRRCASLYDMFGGLIDYRYRFARVTYGGKGGAE